MLLDKSYSGKSFNDLVKVNREARLRREASIGARTEKTRKPGKPFRPPVASGRFAGREHLPIEGPPAFVLDVGRVLAELEACDPGLYRLVVEHLPKAVYDLGLREEYPNANALSDGRFAFFGDDKFDYFRFVLLHEVAHNIEYAEKGSTTEEGADAIANAMLQSMGLPPYQR